MFVPVCVLGPSAVHPSEGVLEQLACAWPVELAASLRASLPTGTGSRLC